MGIEIVDVGRLLLLLDQLRLPILVALGILFFLLLIVQARRRYWVLLLVFSAVIVSPLLSHWQLHYDEFQPVTLPLRLMHQNCWGDNPDTDAIFKQICLENPDVVMLQECTPALYWRIRKELGSLGYAVSSDFENYDPTHHHRYNRLVILTKGFKVLKRYKLKNYPVFVIHARSFKTGELYRFVSVHLERCYNIEENYYQNIADQLGEFKGKTILSGDFNLVPWSRYYISFCQMLGLKDGLKGQGLIASFPAPQNKKAAYKAPAFLPIDRLLVSPTIRTKRVDRLPSLGSDHYGFIAHIS
ncbi:MAG: endonuclease/exonuclease/phosphatase family protein [Candidatus Paracaedibacteraceae bacterium]|nr:endonuclease/exonuclease/phosphatase family protein [Candidatus Paracaedibacteraceae bacterium]